MQGVYYMSGTGMELSNNTRPFPLVSLVGLIVVIGSAFVLVRLSGPLGAALATALGWAAMGAIMYYFAQRRLRIDYDWVTVGCFGLVAALCVACCYSWQSAPLAARIALAVVISLAYPLATLFMLLRSRDERHRMHILLSKFRLALGK